LVYPQNIESGDQRLYVSDGSGAFRVVILGEQGAALGTFNGIQGGNPTGSALIGSRLLLTEYNLDLAFLVELPGGSPVEILGDNNDPYTLASPIDATSLGDTLAYVLDTAHNRVVRLRWAGPPP